MGLCNTGATQFHKQRPVRRMRRRMESAASSASRGRKHLRQGDHRSALQNGQRKRSNLFVVLGSVSHLFIHLLCSSFDCQSSLQRVTWATLSSSSAPNKTQASWSPKSASTGTPWPFWVATRSCPLVTVAGTTLWHGCLLESHVQTVSSNGHTRLVSPSFSHKASLKLQVNLWCYRQFLGCLSRWHGPVRLWKPGDFPELRRRVHPSLGKFCCSLV